jgi:ATP-binding cassette subfamily F protein 3
VETGYQVDTAFYAQHQLESLNLSRNLLDELGHAAPLLTEREVRTVLGCFLFTGDSVFKKIKLLSGGEKARVALAKTLVQESNLLLLDEPTNHLDIQSSGLLAEALKNYKGSFVLISHDRYFVSEVANKIWYVEDGLIKEYPGTYPEFNEWFARRQEMMAVQEPKPLKQEKQAPPPDSVKTSEEKNRLSKLEKELEAVQAKLDAQKAQRTDLEVRLANPEVAADLALVGKLGQEHEALCRNIELVQGEYDRLLEAWMEGQS